MSQNDENEENVVVAEAIEHNLVFGVDINSFSKQKYNEPQTVNHKTNFEKWLNETNDKTNTSFVLKKSDVDYIRDIMMGVKTLPDSQAKNFRKACYLCNLNTKQQSQPRLKPIVSTEIFERVQIDLVNMRNCPYGDFKWKQC